MEILHETISMVISNRTRYCVIGGKIPKSLSRYSDVLGSAEVVKTAKVGKGGVEGKSSSLNWQEYRNVKKFSSVFSFSNINTI